MHGALNGRCPPAFLMSAQPMEPHSSFAWALGDERTKLDGALRGEVDGSMQPLASLPSITMPVTQVVCQIGQIKHVVWGKA